MSKLPMIFVVVMGLHLVTGCVGRYATTFDREVDITRRAALDKLSETEKESLLKENHPILLQMSDPALRGLLQLFAQLPDDQFRELNDKQFLKWRYADLDSLHRTAFEQVLMMNLRMIPEDEATKQKEKLLKMLDQCDVGFAVVQIPSSGERVVSCYVLWPDKVFPSWITVANSKAAMNEEATTAHMTKLAMLKALTHSHLPPAVAKQPEVEQDETTARKSSGGSKRVRPIAAQPIQYQLR